MIPGRIPVRWLACAVALAAGQACGIDGERHPHAGEPHVGHHAAAWRRELSEGRPLANAQAGRRSASLTR